MLALEMVANLPALTRLEAQRPVDALRGAEGPHDAGRIDHLEMFSLVLRVGPVGVKQLAKIWVDPGFQQRGDHLRGDRVPDGGASTKGMPK